MLHVLHAQKLVKLEISRENQPRTDKSWKSAARISRGQAHVCRILALFIFDTVRVPGTIYKAKNMLVKTRQM